MIPGPQDRRSIYEALAKGEIGEYVAVKFVPRVIVFDGTECAGVAQWADEHFEIQIRDDLPVKAEAETVAHEVAHLKSGHVKRIAASWMRRVRENIKAAGRGAELEPSPEQHVISELREWVADLSGALMVSGWRASGKLDW